MPKPEAPHQPPTQNRITAANQRLKGSLTPEMVQNFGLIVYVSKAPAGPLAQRMLVFENKKGALKPIHDWAASTGREQDEISPRGRQSFTATPKGFYQFDPDRMYRRYHSWSWDQDMPHAMFFNWQRRGMMTGLAIHAATGKDIGKLGSRASAGCVHLAPEHAQQLYRLVRDKYRGKVPRFSYNRGTQTMTNSGTFMQDRKGALRMVDGYQVLVVIDDFGGVSRVADLD
jgi:lipoprotein-anchoring transpeptidase ErfK/SrfK